MSTDNIKYRSFLTEASHEEQSRILTGPAKFELTYFDFTCLAATPRYLLAYAKADWIDKQLDPNTFSSEEQAHDLPFGVIPVLKVQPKEGDGEVVVAESWVIDTFLAQRFGLLGANAFEEQTIKAFYSHVHYLRERCLMRMSWTYADKRKEAFETFSEKQLPRWIKIAEQHLERNGGNGHFFGEEITLADVHLVSTLDHFAELPRGEEIVGKFKQSPLLWKVKETVEAHPNIAAWRDSNEFKALQEAGKKFYAFTAVAEE
ncbi:Glutathione S-transferase S1 [Haplosporangium bisporale]|nr:Glutathione S-transferase S1 [Haplosporangium bisporale]